MAEIAPLTMAHAHARKAAGETEATHWSTAADEYQGAAKDFARSARNTSDFEALRVLKLLEEQHHKLARIVRSQDSHEVSETGVNQSSVTESSPKKALSSPPAVTPGKATTAKSKSTTSALAAARLGSQARDSSPSLAREIASRRGIPPGGRSQPSAAGQARVRQLSPESLRSEKPGHPPRIPPSIVDSQASLAKVRKAKKTDDDEGFSRFYSNLTTGTMSKLSSALAYAGLPLSADDITPEPTPSKSGKQTVMASHDPDVRKIFSKAALDAIEEQQRQRGTLGHGFGPAESFYVVPATGMTTSFADMARGRGSIENDEDDFVDAREAPGPPSPKQSRISQASRGSFGKSRTQEELELENTTLKHTLEQLAVRLANFEAHAQDASMAALTQSMMHSPNAAAPDALMLDRLRKLEEQVEKDAEEKQKLATYAKQQDRTLKKWDARYAKLKDSAMAKQKAKETVAEAAGGDAGGSKTPDIG